jgi:hypothetical protein
VDDDQMRNILANLPQKLSRSRLEPYRKLIAALRRRGRPYREIAEILEQKCQLRVSAAAVHNFVRLRLRRNRNREARQTPRAAIRNQVSLPAVPRQTGVGLKPKPQTDEEVWQRIAELKKRVEVTESPEKRFQYDQDQPLHLVHDADTNQSDAGR